MLALGGAAPCCVGGRLEPALLVLIALCAPSPFLLPDQAALPQFIKWVAGWVACGGLSGEQRGSGCTRGLQDLPPPHCFSHHS